MQALIPFPDISPELISVDLGFMTLTIHWYAIAYIVGILVGWRLAAWLLARPALWPKDAPPMTRARLEDYMTWLILGIIVGGRLGSVLFYRPGYYFENPAEIIAVWDGGMSFHGGLLGVVIASYIFAVRHNIPKLSMTDMVSICVPPGLFFGRLANFVNAELWGAPTDLPWAVAFPGSAAQSCGQAAGEICGRHPSQLYEAALEGLLLFVLLLWLALARKWLRHPGRIAAIFLAGYAASRFLVEFVRVADWQFITPDNPVGYVLQLGPLGGLTMGQLLTLPMFIAAIWLFRAGRTPRQQEA